ncbi:hypothetical protein GCM10027160_09980 [Streptomyces calidiresistens]|uniref:alpha/beta fold hydrolase n=1 Tax=Streptomyces calidiresistens TaxID=1485586 RepID=UPI0015FAAB65|nr:hypothetical protein [Streptomyces calidiresistens]
MLPRLSTVTCPVPVIRDADDQSSPPDFGRARAEAFPHARFELIPDAGPTPTGSGSAPCSA